MVIAILGARERRLLGRRRAKNADPEPAPVPTTRATLILGQPIAAEDGAALLKDPEAPVDAELAVLNRVIALHRVASVDPTVREVRREQALVVRVGFGRGEEVADGLWTEAVELPERRGAVRVVPGVLRPQERLAALLGGRDAALACEELALRARGDLEAGRTREAALQLRIALEAAIAELEAWRDRADISARIEELKEHRGAVGAAANAALQGGLDEPTMKDVEAALERVAAALRARTAGGFS